MAWPLTLAAAAAASAAALTVGACAAPTVASSGGVASPALQPQGGPGNGNGNADGNGAIRGGDFSATTTPPPLTPAQASRPSLPGTTTYGSQAGAELRGRFPTDSLRFKLLDEVRRAARQARRPEPTPDVRLDAVAQDLARNLRGGGAELPPFEIVDFLVGHYGLVEAAPNLLLARASGDADAEVAKQMASQIAEVLKSSQVAQVGVGVYRAPGGEMGVVVALQEKNVELGPVPRRIAAGATIPMSGRLLNNHRQPEVLVTAPDGQTREAPVSVDAAAAGNFRANLRCDRGPGRYQVEVTGVDALGPSVVANFPVFCAVSPPVEAPRPAAARASPWTAAESEARLLELVNRDRLAARLRPLATDQRLAEVARAHSRDMVEHDFVGHVSRGTGNAMDRVRAAGLQPALLLENVGRAYTPDEIEAGLMQSPGHRANILDRRATRIGIGVVIGAAVTGSSPLLATQLFM